MSVHKNQNESVEVLIKAHRMNEPHIRFVSSSLFEILASSPPQALIKATLQLKAGVARA